MQPEGLPRQTPRSTQYVVAWPLIVVRTRTGSAHLYQGAAVPPDVEYAQLEDLIRSGAIRATNPRT